MSLTSVEYFGIDPPWKICTRVQLHSRRQPLLENPDGVVKALHYLSGSFSHAQCWPSGHGVHLKPWLDNWIQKHFSSSQSLQKCVITNKHNKRVLFLFLCLLIQKCLWPTVPTRRSWYTRPCGPTCRPRWWWRWARRSPNPWTWGPWWRRRSWRPSQSGRRRVRTCVHTHTHTQKCVWPELCLNSYT